VLSPQSRHPHESRTQLISVCRTEPHLLERLADNPEWSIFLEWNRSVKELVRRQDREKLDAQVPDEAVLHVLEASRAKYHVSKGYVRVRRLGPDDQVLSSVEVVRMYGSSFLEDVNEYGLARIPDQGGG
jgi:hypothetical protein